MISAIRNIEKIRNVPHEHEDEERTFLFMFVSYFNLSKFEREHKFEVTSNVENVSKELINNYR